MTANDSVKVGRFGIFPLHSNHRLVCIVTTAIIDKLLDALRDSLVATNAAGSIRTNDAYQKLLDQLCVIYPTYWLQDLELNYGDDQKGEETQD